MTFRAERQTRPISVSQQCGKDIKVCLVSPVRKDKLNGGITRWTDLMYSYWSASEEVELIQVDIAPRWRSQFSVSALKRAVFGGLQLLPDYISFLRALWRRPDVVHIATSGSLAVLRDAIMCMTSRLLRIPVVYHFHLGRSIPAIAEANGLEWHWLRNVMRISETVIAITPDTVDTIKNCLPDVRVVYIPNPVQCQDHLSEVDNKNAMRTVLFLGWVIPRKGVKELLSAWSEAGLDDWNLDIAGPLDPTYVNDLTEKYSPNNLALLGELEHDKAMDLLERCDIFVLPSYSEGFPNVVLEAMSFGKPIVATSVGGIPDMLEDQCGLLIPPKDVEELRLALIKLANSDELRRTLGQKAFAKVRMKFATEVIFPQYREIWCSLRHD